MAELSSFGGLIPLDHGLCVMSTLRSDGSIQSTLVNAGVISPRGILPKHRRHTIRCV